MDLGFLPPLPAGLMSAAMRDLASRGVQLAAAAQSRLPSAPAAVIFSAVLAAWLVNSMSWRFDDARFIVVVCSGSLVATAALAVGWASQPGALERWTLRAGVAALASALPAFLAP